MLDKLRKALGTKSLRSYVKSLPDRTQSFLHTAKAALAYAYLEPRFLVTFDTEDGEVSAWMTSDQIEGFIDQDLFVAFTIQSTDGVWHAIPPDDIDTEDVTVVTSGSWSIGYNTWTMKKEDHEPE